MCKKSVLMSLILSFVFFISGISYAVQPKGIYINQGTLENLSQLKRLIEQSKAVGINTFVVDLATVTKNYQRNVKLIKDNGIRYVARIVVFPDGGRPNQIKSQSYWEGKYRLAESAIRFGADEIQLDYIRYNTKQPPSAQNAKDVKQVIKYFKQKLASSGVPLQIDIFGEVSFKESPRIGQNVLVFADTVDAMCPMVYPSHYYPYQKHSKQPYEIIYKSLTSLKGQFKDNKTPFKLTPYIEASNYHYKWSNEQKRSYILKQIKAVEDAKADGWYVWSPKNHYDNLFNALKSRNGANAI